MKSLSFVGNEKCKVIDGIKIELPYAFSDESFYCSTIPYRRIDYKQKNDEYISYFKCFLDRKIDGTCHCGLSLTRIDKEGFLYLPIEAINSPLLLDYVYVVGMGDHIELRLTEPNRFNDSFFEEVSSFLALFE